MLKTIRVVLIGISLAVSQACHAVPHLITQETLITTLRPEAASAMTTQFDYLPWGYHIDWSPDMKKVAYWATNEKGMYLVVNGVAEKPYDVQEDGSPRGGLVPPDIVFSPDSQHYAYIAKRGKKHFVVRDGKQGTAYDWIAPNDLHFSADSKRMAYWARRGKRNLTILHDGGKIKEFGFVPRKANAPQSFYNEDVLASRIPSWKIIERGDKKIVLYQDRESAPYDAVYEGNPYYSADYKHAAWRAERDGKLFLIVDGVEADKTYPTAPGLRLPPLVFEGQNALHTLMLRDGQIWRVEVSWTEK